MGCWLEMGLGIEGIENALSVSFRNVPRVWFGDPLWDRFVGAFGFAFSGWFGRVVRGGFGACLGLDLGRVLEMAFGPPWP